MALSTTLRLLFVLFNISTLVVADTSAQSLPYTNPVPKQIATVRRRAGLTHTEYLYYRVLVHGKKAWDAPTVNEKPSSYVQDHVFDSVFGTTANPNPATESYSGRDDVTELYASSMANFQGYAFSNYTATVIGADGPNFNDYPTAFSMIAQEEFLTNTTTNTCSCPLDTNPGPVTAFFWVASTNPQGVNNATFGRSVASAITQNTGGHVYASSIHTTIPGYDSRLYFGGFGMPTINAVVKLWLCDAKTSVAAVRAAQVALPASLGINVDVSFIVFARAVTLWDLSKNLNYNPTYLGTIVTEETDHY